MTKYIEIEEAEKAFRETFKNPSEMGNAQAFINILRHDVPAADVKPVVRGEWINTRPDAPMFGFYYCSLCGRKRTSPQDRFCPNCGAEMRGDKP